MRTIVFWRREKNGEISNVKMFGKMKYGKINPAIIEVYNSVKNGYFYDSFSKKHTAVNEKWKKPQ